MTGRPTKYNPGIHTQLVFWMAKNGLTDNQISKQLHITKQTLNNWKKRHSEFFDSLKKGKDQIDILVEGSLLQRALGYEYEETHREKKDGKMTITRKIKKHVHPEVIAQIFWLKNRRPAFWRDRKEVGLTGEGGGPILHKIVIDERLRDEKFDEDN